MFLLVLRLSLSFGIVLVNEHNHMKIKNVKALPNDLIISNVQFKNKFGNRLVLSLGDKNVALVTLKTA